MEFLIQGEKHDSGGWQVHVLVDSENLLIRIYQRSRFDVMVVVVRQFDVSMRALRQWE